MLALAKVYLLKGDLCARSTVETALAMAPEFRRSHHAADALTALGGREAVEERGL